MANPIIRTVNDNPAQPAPDAAIERLEDRVSALVQALETQRNENDVLRRENAELRAAREGAERRVHAAREQIERMIEQLKRTEAGDE